MHQAGNKYFIEGEYFILAKFCLNDKDYAVLINLSDGNRWIDPVEVRDFRHITDDEMKKICRYHTIELLTAKIKI